MAVGGHPGGSRGDREAVAAMFEGHIDQCGVEGSWVNAGDVGTGNAGIGVFLFRLRGRRDDDRWQDDVEFFRPCLDEVRKTLLVLFRKDRGLAFQVGKDFAHEAFYDQEAGPHRILPSSLGPLVDVGADFLCPFLPLLGRSHAEIVRLRALAGDGKLMEVERKNKLLAGAFALPVVLGGKALGAAAVVALSELHQSVSCLSSVLLLSDNQFHSGLIVSQ